MRKSPLLIPMMLTLTWLLLGCAAKQPIHPGAINAFDSTSADDLLLLQTVLCGTTPAGATACTGGLNAEVKQHPKLLPYLQTATKSYNTAEALYEAWVSAMKAQGTSASATTTPPANVQQAITQAKTDTATAQRQLQGQGGTQ